MITGYPTPLATWSEEPVVTRAPQRLGPAPIDGSWRYPRRRVSRLTVASSAVLSAALHAALLWGPELFPKKPVRAVVVEEPPIIRLVLPDLKELEEPETLSNDETPPPVELAVPVPMQADLPSLPSPTDFVQPLDLASLLQPPDLSQARLTVIPEHYIRGTRIAERIGKVFNLQDLDRHPQPLLQPSPTYPFSQRREGASATVRVEFVVDVEGRVVEPVVIESTDPNFNEAAVTGVARWKFRAGTRNGRKVNVRMQVPILFRLVEDIE